MLYSRKAAPGPKGQIANKKGIKRNKIKYHEIKKWILKKREDRRRDILSEKLNIYVGPRRKGYKINDI